MLLRSCSVLELTCGPADDGSSSSEWSVADPSSHDPSPDPEHSTATTFFFLREPWRGEWSLFAVRSLFRLQEAKPLRRSLADVLWEGGGTHMSTIVQSRVGAGEVWATGALPRSGVFARSRVFIQSGILVRSEVLFFSGVMALSSVLDRSEASFGPVRAHVRIWPNSPCSSFEPENNGSALEQGSVPDSNLFRIPGVWEFWLAGSGTYCGGQFYFPYNIIEGGCWRSGWAQIEHSPGGAMWRQELMYRFEHILHRTGVLYHNLESLRGGRQIGWFHQLVVEMRLVDDLSRMTLTS